MKYTAALLVACVVASANAQTLDDLPPCAITCATPMFATSTCSQTDFKCICGQENFLQEISACVQKDCSAAEQETTIKFAQDFCSQAGAPIPSSIINSLTASAASVSPTATSSGSSRASTTTDTAQSAAATGAAGKFGVSGLGVAAAAAALFL